MQDTTPSEQSGVSLWLVVILLLVALVVGGGVGARIVQVHEPPQSAIGPVCPSSAHNVTWPSPPSQVVRYNPPSTAPTVTLQPSQTLEIDLYGPWIWRENGRTGSESLVPATPAGYLDAAGQSCVWRSTAQQAGRAQLQFIGSGMCPVPEATCIPQFFNLPVTVTAGA